MMLWYQVGPFLMFGDLPGFLACRTVKDNIADSTFPSLDPFYPPVPVGYPKSTGRDTSS